MKDKETKTEKANQYFLLPELLEYIRLSRAVIYNYMQSGDFPRPKKLGKKRNAWSRKEVDAWIDSKLGD